MKEGPISQWDSTTTNPPHWSGDMYQNNLTGPPHTGASPRPSPPPPPLFSLPVLYCKLRQQTRGQWGQELPLRITAITHYVPLEPATNNPSEINTAKPDPHTTSKGAPAATQPEDQCGPHLMPVEKAALTLQMESVTPCNNFRGHVHVRTCTNGITHAPPMEPVERLALTASELII